MPAVPLQTPRILRAPERDVPARTPQEGGERGSLWLEASLDGRVHTFELPARRERAIVAGSVRSADIPIDDARVSLVEFHFERAGDKVFIVPAYGARVEVNAARLRRPEAIRDRALVAFAGHVMKVRVVDVPPKPVLRLEHTVTEPDPPSGASIAFGNDTIVARFLDEEDAEGSTPSPDADLNTTLVFHPSAPRACERTTAETPLAKLVHELPTPRAAQLELSELIALREAANFQFPGRGARGPRAGLLVAAAVAGFLLGLVTSHFLV